MLKQRIPQIFTLIRRKGVTEYGTLFLWIIMQSAFRTIKNRLNLAFKPGFVVNVLKDVRLIGRTTFTYISLYSSVL